MFFTQMAGGDLGDSFAPDTIGLHHLLLPTPSSFCSIDLFGDTGEIKQTDYPPRKSLYVAPSKRTRQRSVMAPSLRIKNKTHVLNSEFYILAAGSQLKCQRRIKRIGLETIRPHLINYGEWALNVFIQND